MSRFLIVSWTVVRVVIALLCVGWLLLRLRAFDHVVALPLPEWTRPLGIVLLVAGGFVVLNCGVLLSTPGVMPREFVAFGPYRYVRNPMSLGAVAMECGLGLFCRSVCILIFSGALFVALHRFVVVVEEPGLEQRFGQSYLEYKQAVNRWVPSNPP